MYISNLETATISTKFIPMMCKIVYGLYENYENNLFWIGANIIYMALCIGTTSKDCLKHEIIVIWFVNNIHPLTLTKLHGVRFKGGNKNKGL